MAKHDINVKRILSRYAEQTTMHGLGFLASSRTIRARVFWSVICLFSMGMFVFMLSRLIFQYFSFPVLVKVQEVNERLLPPHITLCDYNQLSVSSMWKLALDIKGFGSYYPVFVTMVILQQTAQYMCLQGREGSDLLDRLCSIREDLTSRAVTLGLLRNMPNETFDDIIDRLGSSLDDTVTHCTNGGIKCQNIREVHLASYFPKCFDYSTQENKESNIFSEEGINNGVTMTLMSPSHLASVILNIGETETVPGFINTFLPLSADGIRLMISTPGVMPNMNQQGINISPRRSTLIGIRGKEIIRKPWPYSTCTETDLELKLLREDVVSKIGYRPHNFTQSTSEYEGTALSYTQQNCRSACIQREIWIQCGCLDLNFRLPFPDVDGKLLCGTLDQTDMERLLNFDKTRIPNCMTQQFSGECRFFKKIIDDLACVKEVTQKYKKLSGGSDCNCPSPCHSYQYDMTISESPWPSDGLETNAAYNELVRYNTYKWLGEFDALIEARSFTGSSPSGLQGIGDSIPDSKLQYSRNKLEEYLSWENRRESLKNYAQVTIYNERQSVTRVEEVEAYSLLQLFSDIGGQLGLWVGISCITICELLDLSAQLISYLCSKHRKEKGVETEKQQPLNQAM